MASPSFGATTSPAAAGSTAPETPQQTPGSRASEKQFRAPLPSPLSQPSPLRRWQSEHTHLPSDARLCASAAAEARRGDAAAAEPSEQQPLVAPAAARHVVAAPAAAAAQQPLGPHEAADGSDRVGAPPPPAAPGSPARRSLLAVNLTVAVDQSPAAATAYAARPVEAVGSAGLGGSPLLAAAAASPQHPPPHLPRVSDEGDAASLRAGEEQEREQPVHQLTEDASWSGTDGGGEVWLGGDGLAGVSGDEEEYEYVSAEEEEGEEGEELQGRPLIDHYAAVMQNATCVANIARSRRFFSAWCPCR